MLGDLIAAGAKIAGGIMGANEEGNAREAAFHANQNNIQMQREFAQMGIQWRAADARAAGIHPIYALGSSGASFTPTSQNFTAGTSMANALAGAGQDIGRAVDSTRTANQKVSAFTQAAQALTLEKLGLENEVLRSEIASKTARLRSPGVPPFPASADPYLIPGQSGSGLVKGEPLKVTHAPASQPSGEGGAISDVGWARTTTGWAPVPSSNVKERIEDQIIPEVMWSMRNNVMPTIGINQTPPPFPAPKGETWVFNPMKQEYQLHPEGGWFAKYFNAPFLGGAFSGRKGK